MTSPSQPYDRSRSRTDIAREALGPLSLGERILLAFVKHPADVKVVSDYEAPTEAYTVDSALRVFDLAFPGFRGELEGKRVLDYGCGDGFQSIAVAKAGATSVQGVDISKARLGFARELKEKTGQENVEFAERISGTHDVVLSQDAFEHFVAPEENLMEMKAALAPGGRIFATFGPPWYAPFGHHMGFFVKLPWINLLFSEKTVYRIRSLYRTDGATGYHPDLNKMTVKRFEALIKRCGLRKESCVYRVVKDVTFLSKLPLLRELFINQIDVVLVPTGSPQDVLVPQADSRAPATPKPQENTEPRRMSETPQSA